MTLVNMDKLQELLIQTKYDPVETDCVVNGFKNGFDLGYRGGRSGVKCLAPNLKICVGSPTILWNKIMKEVKNKRYAGPFEKIPFDDHFIQLPVGLVPKDGGKDTRLIFHLSYPRNGSSINSETPKEFCTVEYPDFNEAICLCLAFGAEICYISKSDFRSAFHNLGIWKLDWPLLILKVTNPLDNKVYYFVDKCLPFGASISCSHFQRVSYAIAHIIKYKSGKPLVSYLDDFLFMVLLRQMCNKQV